MSEIKPFIWAQGQDANVREPIQALQESGWRYGDVPTASNFNWLFKMLTQEIASLRKELITQKDDYIQRLTNQTETLGKKIDSQAEILEKKIEARASKLDAKFTRLSDKHTRAAEYNEGISRTMCLLLRELEKHIRHYHNNLPSFPWPLYTGPETLTAPTEENSDAT